MKKRPLVTVYITNHNYARYLRKAIDTVLSQTMQDFELIIIDDGSKDNSQEIIKEYENKKGVRAIYQRNKGLNVSNNIALRSARGKFIIRLDADDYLDRNALLLMSNVLKNNDKIAIVFSDYYYSDANDNIIGMERRFSFDKEVSLYDKPAHGACSMIRVRCLQNLGGYSENYQCQDGYDLWLKLIERYKVENINLPLFYYRQHGCNLTRDEARILKTRARIKEDFVSKRFKDKLPVLAIIPVRGQEIDPDDVALKRMKEKRVIDWTIASAQNVKDIFKIVITSPDKQVESYIKKRYKNARKVVFLKRAKEYARLNTGLSETVKEIISNLSIKNSKDTVILQLSIEYPFLRDIYIKKMINTMRIFNVDSVICVRPDTGIYYKHNGSGMVPILKQDNFTKLERDYIYKHSGGSCLVKLDAFRKYNDFIVGKTGHVVIDQMASQQVRSDMDLRLAEFLANEYKERS
ncbi:MAG: glycosyltransferase [Candidatus Omnitrophota bacterium]